MRRTRNCLLRAIAVFVASSALVVTIVSTAEAEPSTLERSQVAEEVAASTCQVVPTISALPRSIDPGELCRKVIVENVDPEGNNSGVFAACSTALGIAGKLAARYCAQVIDKLLDPARQIFLDKVVPVAQQLACLTTAPAAFDCLAQQVHVWLKQSITGLWVGLITAATADTQVIALLGGWRNPGLVSLYSDVGALGVMLLLGIVLTSLIISAVRFDFRQFGSVLIGIVVWGVFWSGGVAIAVLLVKASDAAARWMAGKPDATGQTDLTRAGAEFGRWVDYVTTATPAVAGGVHPVYNPGSLTALLICLLLIIAIVVTVVALLMRNVALLLLIVLLPLTLAGTAGPQLTRGWFSAALRLFVAFLLAKPLIVIAIRLGAVLVSVPKAGERQATFTDALLGVTIILVAGLLPGVIYRFSGGLMQTSAGGAPRAIGGVSAQSAQSVQSSMDMTRMIMERNAPEPLYAKSAGSLRRAAATSSGPTAASRGVGAVAGPLGLVAAAGAMAGGAMESVGRWMAGQAATGGGVTGDVEAPHVPSPPISRAAHLGRRQQGSGSNPPGAPTPAEPSSAAGTIITITQTPGAETTHPTLPPPAAPLVIPGTVVPDASTPPVPPKALPGREES